MGAVASIVINDLQATPVAHTFVPLGPDSKGVWWFEDQSPSSVVAYKRLSLSITRPPVAKAGDSSLDRRNRVTIKIYDPKADNITNSTVSGVLPAPSLAYVVSAEITFLMPERSTLQDRKDIRAYTGNLLANANVIAMIDTLQPIY